MCVCNLKYPPCNTHAPYCHLWPVWLYHIFRYYLKKGHDVRTELLRIKSVLIFSTDLSEAFRFLRKNERHMKKNVYWSYVKCRLLLPGFNHTWIFSTDFRKIPKHQITRKFATGNRVVWRGQTDGHDEDNSRFTQFCERAYKRFILKWNRDRQM